MCCDQLPESKNISGSIKNAITSPFSFTRTRRKTRRDNRPESPNNDLSIQVDITYEERGGRTSPKSWTISYRFKEGVPGSVVTADVTRITTNQPVPLEQFRFDGIPQGMYVVDDQTSR